MKKMIALPVFALVVMTAVMGIFGIVHTVSMLWEQGRASSSPVHLLQLILLYIAVVLVALAGAWSLHRKVFSAAPIAADSPSVVVDGSSPSPGKPGSDYSSADRLAVTWPRVLRIWWSMTWRVMLVSFLAAFSLRIVSLTYLAKSSDPMDIGPWLEPIT